MGGPACGNGRAGAACRNGRAGAACRVGLHAGTEGASTGNYYEPRHVRAITVGECGGAAINAWRARRGDGSRNAGAKQSRTQKEGQNDLLWQKHFQAQND
jgi:hypothetical protein